MDAQNEMAMPLDEGPLRAQLQADHFVPCVKIRFVAVLEDSYATFSRNFLACALAGLLLYFPWCYLANFGLGGRYYELLIRIYVLMAALSIAIYLMLGAFLFAVRMVQTGQARMSDLFACRPSAFLRGLAVAAIQITLVHALIWLSDWGGRTAGRMLEDRELEILVGEALFLLSGVFLVWLGLRWLLCYSLIVGENCGVFAALSESSRRMQGNKITALLLLLLTAFWGGCVTFLTCGLGILLIPAITLVLLTTIYAHASGYRSAGTAGDQPPSFPTWGAER